MVDTNVLISASSWRGASSRVIELAAEGEMCLFTSRVLLGEPRSQEEAPQAHGSHRVLRDIVEADQDLPV